MRWPGSGSILRNVTPNSNVVYDPFSAQWHLKHWPAMCPCWKRLIYYSLAFAMANPCEVCRPTSYPCSLSLTISADICIPLTKKAVGSFPLTAMNSSSIACCATRLKLVMSSVVTASVIAASRMTCSMMTAGKKKINLSRRRD